jgi:hypothetical protein
VAEESGGKALKWKQRSKTYQEADTTIFALSVVHLDGQGWQWRVTWADNEAAAGTCGTEDEAKRAAIHVAQRALHDELRELGAGL